MNKMGQYLFYITTGSLILRKTCYTDNLSIVNFLIENNTVQLSTNTTNHVYRDADTVYNLINGSHQIYQALSRIFNKTLTYIVLSPIALVLRLLLSYLRYKIKQDVKNNRVSVNDSIDCFQLLRAKHTRLQSNLKKVKEIKRMSQNDTIPFLIKFALSPLIDIVKILDDWSSHFQNELDCIDATNDSLNSDNFKTISENKLWQTKNQNYAYRF